ncbi:putative HTH-type transcriptional regulator TtgW [compost metagenome]
MSKTASTRATTKTAVRWESARARNRQCILDAAGAVFAEGGFESATMKRIAEVGGVTKVTIYAHYRGKQCLYDAVMHGHLASLPSGELDMHGTPNLGDALRCITDGIGRLAVNPSCQAFCQSLSRSGHASDGYRERWNAMLQPYFTLATQAFAKASARSTNADDGEKFVRLVLIEHGLVQGSGAVSESHTTIALFLRAYGLLLEDAQETVVA